MYLNNQPVGDRDPFVEAFGSRKGSYVDHTQAIEFSELDHFLYDDLLASSSQLTQMVTDGKKKLETYPELSEDIYFSLFKKEPLQIPKDEMTGSHLLNWHLIDNLLRHPAYLKLHEMSAWNYIASAIGLQSMHEEIMVLLEQRKEEIKKIMDQLPPPPVKQDGPPSEGGQPGPGGDQSIPGSGQPDTSSSQPIPGDGQPSASGNQPAPGGSQPQSKPQADPALNKKMQDLADQIINEAANKTANNVDESLNILRQWGTDPAQPSKTPIETMRKAVDKIRKSQQLRQFAELLGRMRQLAMKVGSGAGRPKPGKPMLGSDIAVALPSEKMLLLNPTTCKWAHVKIVENEVIYIANSATGHGRGPIVVEVDISGSMKGEKERWAKATALALLEIAHRQGRSVVVVLFNAEIVHEQEFKHGRVDLERLIRVAETGASGGTDFEKPLDRALHYLNRSAYKHGDIVFITDGECQVTDRFLKRFLATKAKRRFKVYTVSIGDRRGGGAEVFSDEVIPLNDLKAAEQVSRRIFKSLGENGMKNKKKAS